MKLGAPLLAFALLGAAPPHQLDMLDFFTGKTHADNVMKIALQGSKSLVVDSIGGKGDRGDFVLIDTVNEQGKPVRTRKWIMHPAGPSHFTGSLSDAIGPVDIVINGDSATIRYLMRDGHVNIVQQIQLQPGGKSLSNHVVARKFGMVVAHIDGTIRKLD
jgi:Protein of unknown function (DUF3833)